MSQKHLKLIGCLAMVCVMLTLPALCGQHPKTPEQDKADSNFEFGEFSGSNSGTAVMASASRSLLAQGKSPVSNGVAKRRAPSSPLGPPLNLRADDDDIHAKLRNWYGRMMLAGFAIGGTALAAGIKNQYDLLLLFGLATLLVSWVGFGQRWLPWMR